MRPPSRSGRALRGIHRLSPRRAVLRLPPGKLRIHPRLLRDQYLWYTALLAPIALVTALADGQLDDVTVVLALSPVFIGVQALLGRVPSARRPLTDLGWSFLRLLVAFSYVVALVALVGGASRPLAALYLPVVVAAAAVGLPQGIVLGVLGTAIYLAPILGGDPRAGAIAARAVALAGVGILLAAATRRLIRQLEGAAGTLRAAIVAERRRSRQIAGMEAVSRALVVGGDTDEILRRALAVLSERFGYRFGSIYLWDGGQLLLGAQQNYTSAPLSIQPGVGIVGRVARSHELAFVADVGDDADYVAVHDEVVSEICAPLLIDGAFLGALNVESTAPLDRTDRDLVATLADRVATVVALGRDRQALSERAGLFRNLHEFSGAISLQQQPDDLAATLVQWTDRVVSADLVVVTTLDRDSGSYLVRAGKGIESNTVGAQIRPGEGVAGRAIRDRVTVVDEHFGPQSYPPSVRGQAIVSVTIAAGVPLVRDSVVVGAITVGRVDASARFRPIELEALELLAGHASLALANAFLHADVAALALRDPLTGLYNRRYFDETLERILAEHRRARLGDPKPLAAVMFDLDLFGQFNKQHGHQIGDAVLRSFAEIMRRRFRGSDLVARFGGEEFIAILDGATRDDGMRIAEDVRERVAKLEILDEAGNPLHVTVSAGCAALDDAEPSREALLRTADVALFMAKRAGRDRVVAA
ncbi:MAG: diguanylate cyclase [Chloroflexi bacterium]|nr:MAG: diguanylate cyclase [Chloroflexota bacterium]